MTNINNNICELTQVHWVKVVWKTIVPLGWTIGWDTVAWVRVSPLAGLLQPGLEYTLAWWDNVAWVMLGYRVGHVAWVRVSPLAGLLGGTL